MYSLPNPTSAQPVSGTTARLAHPSRLAALRATGMLDNSRNPVLDRLTRLVTRLLGVPISLVSLVDDAAQHFPGMHGLGGPVGETRCTPLTHSFCQHVVTNDALLQVNDASLNPLVQDNLAFTELGVIAYAGVPLRTAEGETLGALCAIDMQPVDWTPEQIAILEDLATAAMAEIELRSTVRALLATQEQLRTQSNYDALTGLLNRRGFMEFARRQWALAERVKLPFLIMSIDLDDFSRINEALGHAAGDEALMEMSRLICETFRASDCVARSGGDEFMVLVTNCGEPEADRVRERLHEAIELRNIQRGRDYRMDISIGITVWRPDAPKPLAQLLRMADEAMQREKQGHRLESRIDPV
jgi:diguanylate cyclase (GGDEF)-like protein